MSAAGGPVGGECIIEDGRVTSRFSLGVRVRVPLS